VPKNTLFYILLSIVVAILLGDLWVIYPQLSSLHKNIIEDKLKKTDSSLEKKDSSIKNNLLPLSNSSGEVAVKDDESEKNKKENNR